MFKGTVYHLYHFIEKWVNQVEESNLSQVSVSYSLSTGENISKGYTLSSMKSARGLSPSAAHHDYYSSSVAVLPKDQSMNANQRNQSGDRSKDFKNVNSSSGTISASFTQKKASTPMNISGSLKTFDYSQYSKYWIVEVLDATTPATRNLLKYSSFSKGVSSRKDSRIISSRANVSLTI